MQNISDALKAHYALPVTTLAVCWKVTLKSGSILGFTSNSSDLVFDGVTYSAAYGQTPSAVQTSSAYNVDNLEVIGILSGASISDADLKAGLWDYAQIELFEVNYTDLTMGKRIVRTGMIGQVTTGRTSFQAELRGLMQAFQQTIGRIYGDTCDAVLGDTRCGLNLTAFTFAGTVTSVSDKRTFTATMSQDSGYFDYGKITFSTGQNAARVGEVREFLAPNSFILQLEMPFDITVGDTFSVIAGDDKSLVTCDCKFNNSVNFRAFPTVPGQDRMVSGT